MITKTHQLLFGLKYFMTPCPPNEVVLTFWVTESWCYFHRNHPWKKMLPPEIKLYHCIAHVCMGFDPAPAHLKVCIPPEPPWIFKVTYCFLICHTTRNITSSSSLLLTKVIDPNVCLFTGELINVHCISENPSVGWSYKQSKLTLGAWWGWRKLSE